MYPLAMKVDTKYITTTDLHYALFHFKFSFLNAQIR